MNKTYLGNGVFVKIIEPAGLLEITQEEQDIDLITLDPPTIENLLKFLERMK